SISFQVLSHEWVREARLSPTRLIGEHFSRARCPRRYGQEALGAGTASEMIDKGQEPRPNRGDIGGIENDRMPTTATTHMEMRRRQGPEATRATTTARARKHQPHRPPPRKKKPKSPHTLLTQIQVVCGGATSRARHCGGERRPGGLHLQTEIERVK